jgi:hypothetical protein
MAESGGPDAREHPRASARIKVEYNFGSTTGVGHTLDISEGGLFLSCHRIAQPGTRVYLRLYLPGSALGDPLKVIGVVVRAREPFASSGKNPADEGMGIHFEVAYARTREALNDFVQNLLLHPDLGGQNIEMVPGSSHEHPAFAVQLATDEPRGKTLSAYELNAAFSFEPKDEAAGGRLNKIGALAVKVLLFLAVVGTGAYLLARMAGMLAP